MKIKFEITDKERHILYIVQAIVISIANGVIFWYSEPVLNETLPDYLKIIVGITMGWVWILTTLALFKYYSQPVANM